MIKENHPDNNVENIEYVSKQDAKDYIDSQHGRPFIGCTVGEAMKIMIDEVKPADVVPVRHGKWLPTNDDNKKKCNKCDTVVLIAMYPMGNANFCPNCGVKMDGEE